MTKEIMLWNNDRTAVCKAGKIREIVVYHGRHESSNDRLHSEVKGWYNKEEYFDFGWFNTEDEANKFMEELQKQIEGR